MMNARSILLSILLVLTTQAFAQEEPDLQNKVSTLQEQLNSLQLGYARIVASADTQAAKDDLFRHAVLPILETRCFKCHTEEKQKGELRLDSLAHALEGGETEPAIIPGNPDESLLIRAIRRSEKLKMPKKEGLPQGEIDILTAWVALGAPWPESDPSEAAPVEVPQAEVIPTKAKDVPKVSLALEIGDPISFNRDIRPILSDTCSACHGPDQNARKASLRFDVEDVAFGELPSGRRAVVPGDLEGSQLFQRIAAQDSDDIMPPSDFHKSLNQEQIELIGRWILQGAKWESHWAFTPPERPKTPLVQAAGRIVNDIDNFILSVVEEKGLTPTQQADRRTLIRRVTLDLTGLPPTPEEVNTFVNDTHIDAFEQVVDRLLASPQYGEHMTRSWLDIARYADTNGYHIDNERTMWRWRDWVIDAYNSNKPFDEFTIEQIAGDLLDDPTEDQLIATGFNRNHMVNFEGGAIPEEYRVQYVADRVDTTATAWLGLTMACAKCHDHKYDPISQKEYYEMFSFFNTIDETGLDGNTPSGDAKPLIPAPYQTHRDEMNAVRAELAIAHDALYAPVSELDAAFDLWASEWQGKLAQQWKTLIPENSVALQNSTLLVQDDLSVLASGDAPPTDIYTVEATTDASQIRAFRLEALPDESFSGKIGRAPNGNFILTEFEVQYASPDAPDTFQKVTFVRANVDIEQPEFPIALAIDDNPATGWAPDGHGEAGQRTAVFVPSKPFGFEKGTRLRIKLAQENAGIAQHLIGRFRISVSEDPSWSFVDRNPWKVSGPFAAANEDDARNRSYLSAESLDLDGAYPDGRLKWNRTIPDVPETEARTIEGGLGATYFYRNLESPVDRTLNVTVGTQESMRLWLNGMPITIPEDIEQLRKNKATITLDLKQGKNDILVRLTALTPTTHFFFDIMNEDVGPIEFPILVLVTKPQADWSASDMATAKTHYRAKHWDQWDELSAVVAALEGDLTRLEEETPMTMVMGEMTDPRKTFILNRGDYDSPTDEVTPDTPAFLGLLAEDAPKDRLGLARWLVSKENPLTARVTVNRTWARFFGRGLVATQEDFGTQGQPPTHPELLDWLATEFMESGWDMKALQRLIVTSATYTQSSRVSPEVFAKDPSNRYLSRATRFRVDAEVVRDSALSIAGLLVQQRGGKSVLPYQPPGLWEEVGYGGNFTAQTFKQSEGDGLFRRSMYTFWKRTSPPPSMMIFDAPNRETCSVRRDRSNTPLQALTLMNDPQFVEAARGFAERILVQGGESISDKINFAFELATARPASARELEILTDIYTKQVERFSEELEGAEKLLDVGDSAYNQQLDKRELAAWSIVASTILNLDETITRS